MPPNTATRKQPESLKPALRSSENGKEVSKRAKYQLSGIKHDVQKLPQSNDSLLAIKNHQYLPKSTIEEAPAFRENSAGHQVSC